MDLAKGLVESSSILFSQREKGDRDSGGSRSRGDEPSIGERLHNLKTQPETGVADETTPPERELTNGR